MIPQMRLIFAHKKTRRLRHLQIKYGDGLPLSCQDKSIRQQYHSTAVRAMRMRILMIISPSSALEVL
jgi:hypothetical protein